MMRLARLRLSTVQKRVHTTIYHKSGEANRSDERINWLRLLYNIQKLPIAHLIEGEPPELPLWAVRCPLVEGAGYGRVVAGTLGQRVQLQLRIGILNQLHTTRPIKHLERDDLPRWPGRAAASSGWTFLIRRRPHGARLGAGNTKVLPTNNCIYKRKEKEGKKEISGRETRSSTRWTGECATSARVLTTCGCISPLAGRQRERERDGHNYHQW